jgi:hypothetical protein
MHATLIELYFDLVVAISARGLRSFFGFGAAAGLVSGPSAPRAKLAAAKAAAVEMMNPRRVISSRSLLIAKTSRNRAIVSEAKDQAAVGWMLRSTSA